MNVGEYKDGKQGGPKVRPFIVRFICQV